MPRARPWPAVPWSGLVRYLVADLARSQHWVAPGLVYVVVVVISNTNHASVLSTYAATAVLLFFASTWLSYSALGTEDPTQSSITVATVGDDRVVYATKLAVCWTAALVLGTIATLWPLVVRSYTPPLDPPAVLEGWVAHALTALFGVAVAGVGRHLVRRLGWMVLLCCGVGLAEVRVPHLPPVHDLLSLFDSDHPHGLPSGLAVTSAETVALFMLLAGASFSLPRRYR